MKRKFLAIVLAALLALTLFPMTAGAEEPSVPEPLAGPYALTIEVSGAGALGVKIGDADPQTVTGSQQFSVNEDTQVTLTWSPEEGSYLDTLSVGGTEVPAGEGESETSYTFAMDKETAVAAAFAEYTMFYFDVNIEGPGTLSMLENGKWEGVASMEDSIEVTKDSTLTLKAFPAEGAAFDSAVVDGQPADVTETEDGGYVFEVPSVQADGSIEVVFTEKMADISVDIEGPGGLFMLENGKWFGVAEGEGSISVAVGSTVTLRAYPEEGASFLLAVVNGQPVNVTETGDGGYEFKIEDIQADSTVEAAFLGAIDIGVMSQDNTTGIEYFLPSAMVVPGSNITPDSWLEISAVTGGDAYASVKAAVAKFGTVFKAYDIALMNGEGAYQPNIPVYLRFPLPEGYSTNPEDIRLVHIGADGSVEELEFEWKQGDDGTYSMEIQTGSFSTFVIVDSSKTAAAAVTETKAPKTGDTENMMFFLVLAAVSAGLAGCAARRLNGKKAR